MNYANLTGTSIRRAAVRGAQLDGIAARRSTERLLSQMPDTVPGMSASAVLCVREMSVHVRSRPRYMQSGGSVLGAEMERLARQAVRPAHGTVPLHAEAVLFADRAELLSCLARDLVRHLLAQGWWWRVLLPGPSLAHAAMQMWVDEAAHVPAAFARLARTQDAVTFVRTLGDAEASAVVQAIVRAHGLALLAEDLAVAPLPQSNSQLVSPSLLNPQLGDVNTSLRTLEREIHAALPEVWAPGLSVAQRQLLAVGLSLARVPGLVRSAAYAKVLPVMLAQASLQAALVDKGERAIDRESSDKDHPLSSSLPEGERVFVPSPAGGRGSGRGLPETNTLDTLQERDGHAVDHETPVETLPLSSSLPEGERVFVPSHAGGRGLGRGLPKSGDPNSLDTGLATSLPPDDSLPSTETPVAVRTDAALEIDATPNKPAPELAVSLLEGKAQVVETAYGGVFFLCNAALALDLYADFTRPLDRGLELSFWDFLVLASVDLGGPAVRHDPLWSLLGALAGRKTGKRPGAGFAPPREWRLPLDWLLPFVNDSNDWTWEADAARLVVRHPAGFVVIDLLRTEMSADEQLHVELANYELPGIRQASRCRRSPVTPFARWRGWVMPYLARRVARALGDAHWRRACRQLLHLHGRIECDAERLEVHFSLEQLPVAVRIAGLDRDPGWIPAAGRDLCFYFGCDDA